MTPTLTPTPDKVLLELLPPTRPTSDLIAIPDTAQELSLEFKVLAVGAGTPEVPRDPDLQPGQRVIVGPFGSVEVKHRERTYYLAPTEQVLAVIEDGSS